MYIYIHTHTHTHTYIYIYIYICLSVFTCGWAFAVITEFDKENIVLEKFLGKIYLIKSCFNILNVNVFDFPLNFDHWR